MNRFSLLLHCQRLLIAKSRRLASAKSLRLPQIIPVMALAALGLSSATAQDYSTVILDPGHGGKEPGAVYGSVREKDVNLSLALAVEHYLHGMGINTALTRDTDLTLSLPKRARYPSYFRNPLFVSLHYNGATRKSAEGIETFYHSAASKPLAALIQNALIQTTDAVDRGVRHRGFHVIRNNTAPVAVLVEGGFLSHQGERRKVAHAGYRDAQARAIASAIAMFMGHRQSLPPAGPSLLVRHHAHPSHPAGQTSGRLVMATAPSATARGKELAKPSRFWRLGSHLTSLLPGR